MQHLCNAARSRRASTHHVAQSRQPTHTVAHDREAMDARNRNTRHNTLHTSVQSVSFAALGPECSRCDATNSAVRTVALKTCSARQGKDAMATIEERANRSYRESQGSSLTRDDVRDGLRDKGRGDVSNDTQPQTTRVTAKLAAEPGTDSAHGLARSVRVPSTSRLGSQRAAKTKPVSGAPRNGTQILVSLGTDGSEPEDTMRSQLDKVAFSVRDVAMLLGVHRNTVYAQVKCGKIPVVYVGTKPLVPRRWIEETFGLVPSDFTTVRRARNR